MAQRNRLGAGAVLTRPPAHAAPETGIAALPRRTWQEKTKCDLALGWHLRQFAQLKGRQFVARIRKWARSRKARCTASKGAGGTLYFGRSRNDRQGSKETGEGLLDEMLADLGIDRDDFQGTERVPDSEDRTHA